MAAITTHSSGALYDCYEVKAGVVCLQVKTVWSTPERLKWRSHDEAL